MTKYFHTEEEKRREIERLEWQSRLLFKLSLSLGTVAVIILGAVLVYR